MLRTYQFHLYPLAFRFDEIFHGIFKNQRFVTRSVITRIEYNDSSKSEAVSSKGSFFSWHTFCLHANFDPDLIYIYWCGMCQLENSKPKFCFGFFAYNQGKLNGIFFYLMAPLLLKSECCNPCSSSLSPLSPASKFAKLLMHILSFFSLEFR